MISFVVRVVVVAMVSPVKTVACNQHCKSHATKRELMGTRSADLAAEWFVQNATAPSQVPIVWSLDCPKEAEDANANHE
jgi:hypothetical protein